MSDSIEFWRQPFDDLKAENERLKAENLGRIHFILELDEKLKAAQERLAENELHIENLIRTSGITAVRAESLEDKLVKAEERLAEETKIRIESNTYWDKRCEGLEERLEKAAVNSDLLIWTGCCFALVGVILIAMALRGC